MPFHADGETYQLLINFFVFSKPSEPGQRRNFVAYDHAVIFTSNGQAHHHWTPAEFRWKTKHNKLYDRIFVVVETDSLPIEIRSSFFTADRSGLVHTDLALKLEEAVVAFINEWDELRRINGELVREAIASRSNDRATINIARQISRALVMKGFSLGPTMGESGGGTRPPGSKHLRDIELHDDPTYIKGPKHAIAEEDKVKFITFTIDAKDGFVPERVQLEIDCNHPDIERSEISVGELKSGRIRVSIAIPPDPELGEYNLKVSLDKWLKKSGGLGSTLSTTTVLEIVKENTSGKTNPGKRKGKKGPSEGALVALRWISHNEEEAWNATTVGDLLMVPAEILAEESDEYEELKSLGDKEIPTLRLNQDYFALKKYSNARAHKLTEDGLNSARDRYAVGVGVGLCMIHQKIEKMKKQNNVVPDEWIGVAHESLARSVLSMMPEFDRLMKEAGIDSI